MSRKRLPEPIRLAVHAEMARMRKQLGSEEKVARALRISRSSAHYAISEARVGPKALAAVLAYVDADEATLLQKHAKEIRAHRRHDVTTVFDRTLRLRRGAIDGRSTRRAVQAAFAWDPKLAKKVIDIVASALNGSPVELFWDTPQTRWSRIVTFLRDFVLDFELSYARPRRKAIDALNTFRWDRKVPDANRKAIALCVTRWPLDLLLNAPRRPGRWKHLITLLQRLTLSLHPT